MNHRSNPYHDTTAIPRTEKEERGRKALTQEQRVRLYFYRNHARWMTCEDIWDEVFDSICVPLTSVRRAVSNLYADGLLEKSKTTTKGMYGAPIHSYRMRQCFVIDRDRVLMDAKHHQLKMELE